MKRVRTNGFAAKRRGARADDEWSTLNKYRSSLLAQIDGGKLAPLLTGKVLSSGQQAAIMSEPVCERRTAMLLDWLETKPTDAYHAFVEAVGELYPHIYLELTGSGRDDDGTSVAAAVVGGGNGCRKMGGTAVE